MRSALALVAVVLLAGCGEAGRNAAGCTVKVYFEEGATEGQIDDAEAALRADNRAEDVRFVPSEEGLRIMREKYPDLVKGLTYNPIPDTLEVDVFDEDAPAIRRIAERLPAVDSTRGCGTPRVIRLP
jgi:cell division protein FtsX